MKLNSRGISVIFAVMSMFLMGVMVLVMVARTVLQNRMGLYELHNVDAFYGAESLMERGIGALIDDANGNQSTPTVAGYSATTHLDPYSAIANGAGITDPTNACFYTSDGSIYATLTTAGSANYINLTDFQQKINLYGARIKSVDLAYRARLASAGNASVYFDIYNPTNVGQVTTTITSTSWGAIQYTSISGFFSNWNNINQLAIRAYIDHFNTGTPNVYLDFVGLRVTIGVDANTEPWYTGGYVSSPFNFGYLGTAGSTKIVIKDEAGKVNINYAPHDLLSYLFQAYGLANYSTKATAVITNRYYTGIDQLMSKAGLSLADYNLIKGDVTVHSWMNKTLSLPSGSATYRAQINVNTASTQVLTAVFSCFNDGTILTTAQLNSLVADIITRRTTPFSSMYSSYTYSGGGDTNCFATFVDGEAAGTLSASAKAYVKELADGTINNVSLITSWRAGTANPTWVNTYSTELCYYSNAYTVEAQAQRKVIGGRINPTQVHLLEVVGFPYDYNNLITSSTLSIKMPTQWNEAAPQPYWRQIF